MTVVQSVFYLEYIKIIYIFFIFKKLFLRLIHQNDLKIKKIIFNKNFKIKKKNDSNRLSNQTLNQDICTKEVK